MVMGFGEFQHNFLFHVFIYLLYSGGIGSGEMAGGWMIVLYQLEIWELSGDKGGGGKNKARFHWSMKVRSMCYKQIVDVWKHPWVPRQGGIVVKGATGVIVPHPDTLGPLQF